MRIRAGTLGVDITADGQVLEATLKRADSLTESFSVNVDRRMKRASASFQGVGQAAGMTDKEMANLEKRMREGMAADTASRALDNLRKYAGLTAKEYTNLAAKMGLATKENDKASASLAGIAKRAGAVAAAYLSVREGMRVAGDAFSQFAGYEATLVDMARVTTDSLGSIDATIKGLPRSMGDPTAMMGAYYQVLSSGATDSAQAMDLLTTSAKASKAAHVSQSETVKGLTKLMAGYDGEIRSATEASDLLFRIDNLGQTSFAELVPVIGDVAEVTHLVGVTSQEMAAGLALVTQTSGSTSEAATKWKAIMVGLYKPTENMEKVLKALGYESGQAMVQQLGFAMTLQKLQAVAETSGFSMGKLFESSEALTGIAGLGAQEWERYTGILDGVRKGSDETDQAWKRWLVTSQAVKDNYDATLKQMAIEFGGELAPMMTAGMQTFANTVVANKGPIIATLGGIEMSVRAITSILMAATREYQTFANTIAAGIAVGKGEMAFGDWALSGPEELVGKLQAAGDKKRAEGQRSSNVMRTSEILHSDNNGTIPELANMFPGDMAPKAEKAKKAVDGIKVSLEDSGKAAENAALAAERYGEQAAAYFEQVEYAIAGLSDSLAGGLEGETLKVDKTFEKMFADIRKNTIGAKGDTEDFARAWVAADAAWPMLRMIAQIKDFEKELDKAAQYARDMGTYLSDPEQLQAADWLEGYRRYVVDLREARAATDQEDAAAVAKAQARWDAYQDHVLKAQIDRLGEGGRLSDAYWQSEKSALEKHLAAVQQVASDELAYRVYAAEQQDALTQRLLEKQSKYSGSLGDTFAARWSLAFGSYKSDLTQARDDWAAFSDSVIGLSDGMAGAIAGSVGDMVRGIEDGTVDISKLMRSRILDAVAGTLEESFKRQLKEALGGLGKLFGAGSPAQPDQQTPGQITTPQAAVEAANATIHVAAGTVTGLAGHGQSGPTATDALLAQYNQSSLAVGQAAGQAAGQTLAPLLIQAQTAQGQNITQSFSNAVVAAGQKTAEQIPAAMQKSIWYTHSNPGNLRVPGQSAFQQFGSMEDGLQAMFKQLQLDFSRGLDTPFKLLSKYAPATDGNNTEQYAADVAKAMGLDSSRSRMDLANPDQMQAMMEAMVQIETGVSATAVASKETYYNIAHQIQAQATPMGVAAGQAAAPIIAAAIKGTAVASTQQPNASTSQTPPWAAGQGDIPSLSEGLQEALKDYDWSTAVNSQSYNGSPLGMAADADFWSNFLDSGSSYPNAGSAASGSGGFSWLKGIGGVASGVMSGVSAASQGNVLGTIGSGLMTTGSLMMMTGVGGPIGAVLSILGGLTSLFGSNEKQEKEPTQVYSGSMASYANGTTMSLPLTVMSDGTMKSKTIQPEDINKSQQAFDDLTESVKDAAKILKVDLVENFDTTFSMLTGIIPDELADTVNWVMRDKLGKSALGDLAGAVQFFSDGMEDIVTVFTGLSDAAQTVQGSIEALGIDFQRFAGIDDAFINTIASFATTIYAEMEDSGLSSSLDNLASSAMTTAEYVSQYGEVLTALASAQMSQYYEDALGGEDGFTAAMQTYAKYAITSETAKQSALDYYTTQLDSLLSDFASDFSNVLVNFDLAGIDTSNIDTFWSAYNAAMQGTMSPTMLSAWAEMASYAQLLEETAEELEGIEFDSSQFMAGLAYRQQLAAGESSMAEITKTLAQYESELYEARKDGRTYTEQAALVETQIAELQAQLNALMDVSVDATSSYDAALAELTESVSSQVDALSKIASTASGLESTYSSIYDSLSSMLTKLENENFENAALIMQSRLDDFNDLFEKALTGDTDAYQDLADAASNVWDSIKSGGVSAQTYDEAYWTLVNKTATAKQLSSGEEDYQSVIADLAQVQVDILTEIQDELSKESVDTEFIALANKLESFVSDFSQSYDDYNAGRISYSEYIAEANASESNISNWVMDMVGAYATIGMDQISQLVSLGDFVTGTLDANTEFSVEQLSQFLNEGQIASILSSLDEYTIYGTESLLGMLETGNLDAVTISAQIIDSVLASSDSETSWLREIYDSNTAIGSTTLSAIIASTGSTVASLQALYDSNESLGNETIGSILASGGSSLSWLQALYDGNSSIGSQTLDALMSSYAMEYSELSALYASNESLGSETISAILGSGYNTHSWLSSLYYSDASIGAGVLASLVGTNQFLKYLMDGSIELSGLSEQQASLLSSALSSLDTISEITGTGLVYSDLAQYYLSKVVDGTSIEGWDTLISTIEDGKNDLIDSLTASIDDLTYKVSELKTLAALESSTKDDQLAYFKSIYSLMYKQTQIELYTSLLNDAQDTASSYQSYAVAAVLTGTQMGAVVALEWLAKYESMQSEVNALKDQLSYWSAYTPTVALAGGGIVHSATSAIIAEGGESEVVSPLSDLRGFIQDSMPTVVVNNSDIIDELRALGTRLDRIELHTADTADNTDTSFQDAYKRTARG